MKHLFWIGVLGVCNFCIAQSEFGRPLTDPNVHEEQTRLSAQIGVHFISTDMTPCDGVDYAGGLNTRIASKKIIGDTVILDVAFEALCCVEFDTGIEVTKEMVLNLLYSPYGTGCFCSCCYHLTYKIVNHNQPFIQFRLNGEGIIESDKKYKDKQ